MKVECLSMVRDKYLKFYLNHNFFYKHKQINNWTEISKKPNSLLNNLSASENAMQEKKFFFRVSKRWPPM